MVAELKNALPAPPWMGSFWHVQAIPVGPLSNATRYLCAAAYLDSRFRQKVLKELIYEEHRAVAPSYEGFDVGPVVAHCLRARRMALTRDLAFWTLLFLAFWGNPPAYWFYVIGVTPFAVFPLIPWHRLKWPLRLRVGAYAVLIYLIVFWASIIYLFLGVLAVKGVSGPLAVWFNPFLIVLLTFLLWWAMLGISLIYRLTVLRVMRNELAPSVPQSVPDLSSTQVRNHIGRLTSAQLGNITLYTEENPFVGSGDPSSPWAKVWSITMELDRAEAGSEQVPKVDPWELHEHVRRAIEAMAEEFPEREDGSQDRSKPLGPNERIAALNLGYHVIGRGECAQYPRYVDPRHNTKNAKKWPGHPLVDERWGFPYSHAPDEICKAIIRHPQAALRCYQRVTVGAQQQAVKRGERVIVPAEDQGAVVSAFIYIAVEGRMLYIDFVANVLPPVRKAYRIVDELAATSMGSLVSLVVRRQGVALIGDGLLGPFRAIRTFTNMASARMRTNVRRHPAHYTTYDYGTRMSARELGAEPEPTTYMEVLDAHKYSSMIAQRLNEAVLDYLQLRKVDVSTYRRQVNRIMNMNVMTGDNYGLQNFGSGSATQNIGN